MRVADHIVRMAEGVPVVCGQRYASGSETSRVAKASAAESSAFSLAVVGQEREEDHLRRGEDELLYRRAGVATAATHKAREDSGRRESRGDGRSNGNKRFF
jgi:hypothetical protein